jgi:hypothetical protein
MANRKDNIDSIVRQLMTCSKSFKFIGWLQWLSQLPTGDIDELSQKPDFLRVSGPAFFGIDPRGHGANCAEGFGRPSGWLSQRGGG